MSLTFVVSNTDGFNRNGVVMRMPFPAGLATTSHGLIEGGACKQCNRGQQSADAAWRNALVLPLAAGLSGYWAFRLSPR